MKALSAHKHQEPDFSGLLKLGYHTFVYDGITFYSKPHPVYDKKPEYTPGQILMSVRFDYKGKSYPIGEQRYTEDGKVEWFTKTNEMAKIA